MQDFPSAVSHLIDDSPLSSLSLFGMPAGAGKTYSIDITETTTVLADLRFADLSKSEPDLDDLNDLDQLLTDSLAIAKKNHNKRIYKELKKAVDEKILCDFQLERWEVLEDISVWMQTRCKCGRLGEKTFLRNMQKLRKVGSSLLHWKEVKELTGETEVRYALITTEVNGCGCCQEIGGRMFVDFKQIIG